MLPASSGLRRHCEREQGMGTPVLWPPFRVLLLEEMVGNGEEIGGADKARRRGKREEEMGAQDKGERKTQRRRIREYLQGGSWRR